MLFLWSETVVFCLRWLGLVMLLFSFLHTRELSLSWLKKVLLIILNFESSENTEVDKLSPPSVAIASSVSKVLASVMTYPHEVCAAGLSSLIYWQWMAPENLSVVIRSRLQEQGQNRKVGMQYAGVVDCIKKVFQKEGLPGFYRGCATNLIRTTPSAVITFTSYEMMQRFLQRVLPLDKEHSQKHPKPDGNVKPQPQNRGAGDKENDTILRQSQIQSNKITPSIPLGNKDQLTAKH
ncbi:hypothetical protein Pint_22103 [Pistacia integerrima]|uniref:Uncharacterized protein n=1 Tax=Pistacia integerrima TaxID=434235 RepID=A0ACC0YQA8_9ROSI|nr:hypothetical protein Pint_22103 [Pistacia integerrima]